MCDEIHKFHVLELRMERNVFFSQCFWRYLSRSDKDGLKNEDLNGDSNPDINICLSLSDDTNKIKTLNIERAWQFKFSLKVWVQFIEWFRRNSPLKTRNFTRDIRLINFFATQKFHSFTVLFPSILLAKSWKWHKLLNLISSFNFCI